MAEHDPVLSSEHSSATLSCGPFTWLSSLQRILPLSTDFILGEADMPGDRVTLRLLNERVKSH